MHLVVLTQVLDRHDAVLGFFHAWCDALARSTSRLTVIAQQVGDVDLPDHVEVRSLGREHGAGRGAMLRRLARELTGLRGARRPDAVLAHMVPRFVLSTLPWALPRRWPLFLWYTHKGVDLALRLATPRVRAVFTASDESFRLDTPGARARKVVTGHGIDGEHFRPGDEPRPVDVLAVGRLAPSKGQDELLEALSDLPGPPVTEIAGDVLLEQDVPFREALHRRAREMDGRVTLLGAVPYPRVADAMRRARVLVNTSYTGSVDKVVLEAMACGTIPLTCNESFVPILGDELAARLMFPRHDPAALSARLASTLALGDDERLALGARLREIVLRDHDLERLAPRLVAEMEART